MTAFITIEGRFCVLHPKLQTMKTKWLFVLILLSSCALQVKTYQNPITKGEPYGTWCWLQGCEVTYMGPDAYNNPRAIAAVSKAIEKDLAIKGYARQEDTPDLLVHFYLTVTEEEMVVTNRQYEQLRMEALWLPEMYPEYVRYLKGSLVIDVLDREKSVLIWRFNVIRYLDMHPDYDQAAIEKAVQRALRHFPQAYSSN